MRGTSELFSCIPWKNSNTTAKGKHSAGSIKTFVRPHRSCSCSCLKINLSQYRFSNVTFFYQKNVFWHWIKCFYHGKKASWVPRVLTASSVAKTSLSRIEEQILKVGLDLFRDCLNGSKRNWTKGLHQNQRPFSCKNKGWVYKVLTSRWTEAFLIPNSVRYQLRFSGSFHKISVSILFWNDIINILIASVNI